MAEGFFKYIYMTELICNEYMTDINQFLNA